MKKILASLILGSSLLLFAADPPKKKKSDAAPPPITAPEFIGDAPALDEIEQKLPKIAGSEARVLIIGETGTGKDVYARRIHTMSPRAKGPFVAVSLAEINEQLVDAALFGVKKGAFTGATEDKVGLLEYANGGTLFLDELGELPKATQTKLLRALEEKKIKPVGSNEERPIDVRVISATNANLVQAVADGTFREDLYYRLNVFQIEVPPLRERKEDIVRLAEFFQTQLESQGKVPKGKIISQQTFMHMQNYPWPGNVRELRSAVERALVVSDGQMVGIEDLPPTIAHYKPNTAIVASDAKGAELTDMLAFSASGIPLKLEQILDLHCKRVLAEAGGDEKKAAAQLDISREALKKRIKRAGESDPP